MMLSKQQKDQIKEALSRETLMNVTFHANGHITAKKKFRSIAGRTSEMYANKIGEVIPQAKVAEHEIKKDTVIVKFMIEDDKQ